MINVDTNEIQFEVKIPKIHDRCSLLVNDNNEIKFYYDSVAFNGKDSNDEYTTELPWASIETFTKKDFNKIVKDITEYIGFDEETYQEQEKMQKKWDEEIHNKNSQWIKDNNYKIKEGVYKGQWEYNWDEQLGKWLDIQDRSYVMHNRGFDLNFITGKWVPKEKAPKSVFNHEKNRWEYKYPGEPGYSE